MLLLHLDKQTWPALQKMVCITYMWLLPVSAWIRRPRLPGKNHVSNIVVLCVS